MKTLLAFAAAAAAALTAAPAAAQDPGAASARLTVSYADLDLRTEAGVRALDRRILTAVQQACGPTSSFDLAGVNLARACRAEALERLEAQRQIAIAAATRRPAVELAAQR